MTLDVKNLSFSYDKESTLKNISFSAQNGDIVAIIGVNGVGKSTMLKCINRLHKRISGQVLVDGEDISKIKSIELSKKIAYVAQNNPYYEDTVFNTVLLGRKPFIKFDVSKNDLDLVNDILKKLNIAHLSNRNISRLSGGERQKAYIARAIAQQAPILLFDEPTSNLDLKNQTEVLSLIKNQVEENNLISLISIHDINLALRFANKFLLLKKGEVYAFGDSEVINEKSMKDIFDVDTKVIDFEGRKMVMTK